MKRGIKRSPRELYLAFSESLYLRGDLVAIHSVVLLEKLQNDSLQCPFMYKIPIYLKAIYNIPIHPGNILCFIPFQGISLLSSNFYISQMTTQISKVLIIALLVLPVLSFGQTEVIVYDGYTGIFNTYIQNDTASPSKIYATRTAEKAGIKIRDQIIAINDTSLTGKDLGFRVIKDLLLNETGASIDLLIKRRGVDSLLHFSFCREAYLHQIKAYEYEYLIDSLEQWDISDVMSDSLDSLFTNPLKTKSRVFSVEEGSPAAKIGIRPGDQVISLLEELDKEYYYHLSSGVFNKVTVDTSFTILRGDLLINFGFEPSGDNSLRE